MKDLEILAKDLSELTYAEATKLGEILADKYNIKPSAPIVTVATVEPVKEEVKKTNFNVLISNHVDGSEKLQAVKELNAILQIGLRESKAILEAPLPATIKENATALEAEAFKTMLSARGYNVTLK